MKKQPFNPAALIARARDHLAAGRFFVALDLAGQVEHHLSENPGQAGDACRRELERVKREAEAQTAQALASLRTAERKDNPQRIVIGPGLPKGIIG